MSAPDDRRPDDELTRRYLEANAQDLRRPGAHVRQAVQAHAQAVLDARSAGEPITQPKSMEAANQPRWKMSMLASIALAGLTGLLVLQFDRGTPEEKELALGQPRATAPALEKPVSPAAEGAAPALPTSPKESSGPPASTQKPAPPLKTPQPTMQQQPERRNAESGAESKAVPAEGSLSRTPPSPTQESGAAAAPSPFPASPPAAAMQAPPAMADRAMLAPAPIAAPAPAAEARSQAAKPQSGLVAAPRAKAEASGFIDNGAALLEAARSGRSADIAQLIRQGAVINVTDELGRTPLMLAVINGHEAAVQQLLALGASPSVADSEGLTALAHARRQGLDRIVALLEAARQVR